MKIRFSIPKNRDFFNRYATLIPTLIKIGFIAQIVSALTEYGIIYNLCYSRAIDFTPSQASNIAFVAAILGTAFLEIGLRKFTPYSIQAILYKRFKGLDFAMSVFILLVTFGLLLSSGLLSFQGSKEMVEIAMPMITKESTTYNDRQLEVQKKETYKNYHSDSTAIAIGFEQQAKSQAMYFESKISEQKNKLVKYQNRETETGQSYRSRKESIRAKIKSLEVDKAQKLASIESQKASQLNILILDKKSLLSQSDSIYFAAVQAIEKGNKAAIQKAERKTGNYGNGLAYFTLVCIVVFLFSVIISEINKKGSGIENVAILNQYHFSTSILSELTNVISDKYNYHIRKKIINWENTTPLLPPSAPPPLWEMESNIQNTYKIQIEPQQTDTIILANKGLSFEGVQTRAVPSQPMASSEAPPITASTNTGNTNSMAASTGIDQANGVSHVPEKTSHVPNTDTEKQILDYLKAAIELSKCNLNEQAEQMKLKAVDVIKAYLGTDASMENVRQLESQVIGFLNGTNENPFKHHHRQPIGFFNKSKEPIQMDLFSNSEKESEPIRDSYNETRMCKNCNAPYMPNHKIQKYCNEDCRIEFWQNRTGKTLMKKKKK